MHNKEFDNLIKIKIQALVDLIMVRKQYTFEEALTFLYHSQTYKALLLENTKAWHFSTEKLFEILLNEYENNKLSFPDYV